MKELQRQGDEAMAKGGNVPWTAVRIIDTMDKKDLGDALTASAYSQTMATQFIIAYKFRNWITRSSTGIAVTEDYRRARAESIAVGLVSHERWKNHGHAISREVLWDEIQLRIDHPDEIFDRAIVKAWAMFHWVFEKTKLTKTLLSSQYAYVRIQGQTEAAKT